MTALAADRNTKEKLSEGVEDYPVKASTLVYQGSLVVIDAGYLAPGRTATGLIAVGRAEERIDNSAGAAGAISGRVKRGVFKFGNSSAGDAIAQADVGADCYIVDDQTVAKTNGSSTRSRAGKIVAVDSDGVWVQLGLGI
jgi:hypothetical protein